MSQQPEISMDRPDNRAVASPEPRRLRATWCLLAPLLEQKYQNHIENMTEYLDSVDTFGIFERLAHLGVPECRRPPLGATEGLGGARTTNLSALESLPNELLDAIMDDDTTLSLQDIVNLGVCSKRLWIRLLHHVREDMRKSNASWSNTPLICPFLYLRDFPPAMNKLFPDVKAQQDAFDGHPWSSPSRHEQEPTYLWVKRAFETFESVEQIDDRRRHWLRAISSPLITRTTPLWTFQMLKSGLEDALRLNAPLPGEKWVLRNLTANEYVRLEVADGTDVATDTEAADSTDRAIVAYVETAAPWLNLDVALLLRIFWYREGARTQPGTTTARYAVRMSNIFKRGAWAGHCFDVVRCSELLPDTWKDSTDSVVSQARDHLLDRIRNKPDRSPDSERPRKGSQQLALRKHMSALKMMEESNRKRLREE